MPITRVSLPESGLEGELQSTNIPCTYPDRSGPYSVADWAKPIVEETLRTPLFSGMKIRLYRLQDVYACGEGLIFNDLGQLYDVTGDQFSEETITQAHRSVQDALFDGHIQKCEAPVVYCKRASPFVFGHWMVDMLPMAYVAQTLMPDVIKRHVKYMVHVTNGAMDNVFRDSLRRLDVATDQLYWTTSHPVFCKELLLVTGVSKHGRFITSLVSDCHDTVSRNVPATESTRLFVLRGGYVRKLFEEEKLAELARTKGYVVLDANKASFEQQIAAFKNARVVIGAMGSALANLVYTLPGAKVIVLAPEAMPDTFLWLICQLRRLHYQEVRCHQIGNELPDSYPPWSRDMIINPIDFSKLLDS